MNYYRWCVGRWNDNRQNGRTPDLNSVTRTAQNIETHFFCEIGTFISAVTFIVKCTRMQLILYCNKLDHIYKTKSQSATWMIIDEMSVDEMA
jgi:hypothetical protein